MRKILLYLLIFGFCYGFSLATNRNSSFLYYKKPAKHENALLKRLKKDFKLLYTFDIQKTMQAYDKDFIPYKVYIYKSQYTDELLQKYPALGNTLPFSVLTYTYQGNSYVVIPNIPYVASIIGVSSKDMEKINYIQSKLLKDLNINPNTTIYKSIPLFVIKPYNMDFNDAKTFIKSSLESNGMAIPHEYKTKTEDIMYSCNAKWGSFILSDFKDVGVFAPCRVIVYKKSDKTYISYFNPEALNYLSKSLKPTTIDAIKHLNEIIQNSISGF